MLKLIILINLLVYSNQQEHIGKFLLTGQHAGSVYAKRPVEYPGYDGWYNNLAKPDSGAIDRPLLRRWPAAYEDGTYLPAGSNRPNPFDLSDELLSGPIGSSSRTGKNALLVFFGQQVVEEILDAQRPACPPEYFNIIIPKNHRYRNLTGHTEMPLLRTRFDQSTGLNPNNPRQQVNEITPYIDGGLMYGITKQWSDQLRTYSNGTLDPDGLLAHSHDGRFPEYNTHRLPMANPPPPFYHARFIKNHETEKISRFFKLGNPRGNENTFLLTFGVLWFRWHNYLARTIRELNREWSSEEVYNEARKWVIGTQQHIIMDEWLPSWIDKNHIPAYKGYDPSINPQIDQFFQAAAFRFGHTLVTPGVYLRDYNRNGCSYEFQKAVRTCNAFWRPQEALLANISDTNAEIVDIDRLLMGMAYQLCEEEDHKIVEDLRGNVFGPLEFPRRDLMAINIQRGRDHGLPDFNSARRAYGLPNVGFDHFVNVGPDIINSLIRLYKNKADNIDPWVGGILETGDGPGELFEAVIIDQFRRIRDGDRFWYENSNNNLFTQAEISRIKTLRLYQIILAVTKITSNDIQETVFRVPTEKVPGNCSSQLVSKTCIEKNGNNYTCYHLPILTAEVLNETCKDGTSYDYFENSEASFIITFSFLSLFIVTLLALMHGVIHFPVVYKRNQAENINANYTGFIDGPAITAKEWIGTKTPSRNILLRFDQTSKHIQIECATGILLRSIDCTKDLQYATFIDKPNLLIKSQHEYDLVLKFDTFHVRNIIESNLKQIMENMKCKCEKLHIDVSFKNYEKFIITKEIRQMYLEQFFRVVIAQAFRIPHNKEELMKVDNSKANIRSMELTLAEFADVLNMRPDASFVVLMFRLIDQDKNGFISFNEFLQLLTIFADGTASDKAKLLFDIYDIDAIGQLTIDTFREMFSSLLDNVQGDIGNEKINQTIDSMLKHHGLINKSVITFNDFLKLMGDNMEKLNNIKLGIKYLSDVNQIKAKETIEDIYGTTKDISERFKLDAAGVASEPSRLRQSRHINIIKDIQKKSKELFWLILYTLVLLAIFSERAYYYSIEREHSGLRRIAGYGVTVTRGAASAMMFTYSSLLVTMCRNIITRLRDTALNKYFPFDYSVDFHKYIAYWALFFSLLHIIGHAFNFYHISTQTSDDLTCLFRNYFHSTHEIPKFHYWCWQTMTGFTGIVLTVISAIIFIFAQPLVRRKLYNYFWYTHALYPIFFIFMILHGSGRLIQEPYTHYFFLGPVILFGIDQSISISRKKIEIIVRSAKILPSNVTMLEIVKPSSFEYKSGQWVRIACLNLNAYEFHPFTLSSSPDENSLTLHIRAVGPWTNHIRRLYEEAIQQKKPLPKIYIDGPFGEGHQDWYQYKISILIGGGIGVTPFASILKDIAYRGNGQQILGNKVYFIWVSKSQKQFEWFVDMLKEIESKDKNQIINTHIYITQFYEKFDLRTIMLYIFERHYQNLSKKSLFTNLEAVTHFGRPDFNKFLTTIQQIHYDEPKVGVFSCGSSPMISAVDSACIKINNTSEGTLFEHHYKTF